MAWRKATSPSSSGRTDPLTCARDRAGRALARALIFAVEALGVVGGLMIGAILVAAVGRGALTRRT